MRLFCSALSLIVIYNSAMAFAIHTYQFSIFESDTTPATDVTRKSQTIWEILKGNKEFSRFTQLIEKDKV